MKNRVKLFLVICSVILAISAILLASYIWQGTPFFDMNLVFIDTAFVLLTATFLAIAMMSRSD